MAHGVRPTPVVKTAGEFAARDAMKRSDVFFHGLGGGWRQIARDAVEFAAIAGGNDDGFFQNPAVAQFIGGLQGLL